MNYRIAKKVIARALYGDNLPPRSLVARAADYWNRLGRRYLNALPWVYPPRQSAGKAA